MKTLKSKQLITVDDQQSILPLSGGGKVESDVDSGSEESRPGSPTAGPIFGQSRYVDFSNWEAILDEITEITDDLNLNEKLEIPKTFKGALVPSGFTKGPILLMGTWNPVPFSELASHLPARDVADHFVNRFFQGREPAWMMFHIPSFFKRYNEFWASPEQFPLSWLAMLLGMMGCGIISCLGDNGLPGSLGDPLEVVERFRYVSAHCLALDDYTSPGRYKIEALLLYMGLEYFKQPDSRHGTNFICTIYCRLALQMGMHRDPKHFKDISPFEGEMRRRIWLIILEADRHLSYQCGTPCNIQARLCETEPPRNLHDEDFDEFTMELPPSRPESEQTRSLYSIVKARLVAIFGEIFETLHLLRRYSQVLEMDRRLEDVHNSMPAMFAMRSFRQSMNEPINLVMQRYWLDLLYQKIRCVLHRRDRHLPKSRWVCVDAAVKIMRHQYDSHVEMQPGGRLERETLFITSTTTHDFLLANMILCMELSYALKADASTSGPFGTTESSAPHSRASSQPAPAPVMSKEKLLEILRTSRAVWQINRLESAEADRGFKILSRMLTVATGTVYQTSPLPAESDAGECEMMLKSDPPTGYAAEPVGNVYFGPGEAGPALGIPLNAGGPGQAARVDLDPLSGAPAQQQQWSPQIFEGDYSSVWAGPAQVATAVPHFVDGALYSGADINWEQWDNQIQTGVVEAPDMLWNNLPPGSQPPYG